MRDFQEALSVCMSCSAKLGSLYEADHRMIPRSIVFLSRGGYKTCIGMDPIPQEDLGTFASARHSTSHLGICWKTDRPRAQGLEVRYIPTRAAPTRVPGVSHNKIRKANPDEELMKSKGSKVVVEGIISLADLIS